MATYINGHTQGMVGTVRFTVPYTGFGGFDRVNTIFEHEAVTSLVADYGYTYAAHFAQIAQGRYGVEMHVLLVGVDVTDPQVAASQLRLALRGFPDIQEIGIGPLYPYEIEADYEEGDAFPEVINNRQRVQINVGPSPKPEPRVTLSVAEIRFILQALPDEYDADVPGIIALRAKLINAALQTNATL